MEHQKLWILKIYWVPCVSVSRAVGFLRGTSAVVVILVKGHAFPTIVKVRPVGYDPLALVDGFTPVEDNIGLLETRFNEEAVFMFVVPEDVTGLVNLTLLSFFFGVTTTNLSLELLRLGQNRSLFLSVPKVVRVSCPIVQQSRAIGSTSILSISRVMVFLVTTLSAKYFPLSFLNSSLRAVMNKPFS
ncbi:hypothetical protein Tco_0781392 [Tanacetum coccineum]